MKIFVAHKFSEVDKGQLREKLEKVFSFLEKNGHQTFNYCRDRQKWKEDRRQLGIIVKEALEDLKKSDAILIFIDGPERSEGIYMEFGFAKALGKKVILLIAEDASSPMLEAMADQVIKFKELKDLEGKIVGLASYPNERSRTLLSPEDFKKLDLRIGKILSAERIENSDKLLKLEVDFGLEKRQIVSGIAQYFTPESLIGKEAPFVLNLEPRVLRGVESAGMILAASVDGKAVLLHPGEEVPPGSLIK